MPFHGHAGLVHRATVWRRVGTDERSRPVVSDSPVGIDCRWDQVRRTVNGADGSPLAVDVTVVTDRDVEVGSAVWKGDPDDLPDPGRAPTSGVYEVVTVEPTSDWRGVDTVYEMALARAGDLLPAQGPEPD